MPFLPSDEKPTRERHDPAQHMADKWDQRYRNAASGEPEAATVLRTNAHLLPTTGEALDLACGLGGNALLLARHGLSTQAWDISAEAIAQLAARATRLGLPLHADRRDVMATPPAADSLDVIVVSRFLERALCPALVAALRPGGLLFYQTFTREKARPGGPSNPAFLLAENELLSLFAGLRLHVYREEGALGDAEQGLRNEALLVASRPR